MRAENIRARELVQTAKWCGQKPEGLSGPKRCLSRQSELRGWDGHQTGHEMRLGPNDTTDNVLDGGPEEGVVGGSVKGRLNSVSRTQTWKANRERLNSRQGEGLGVMIHHSFVTLTCHTRHSLLLDVGPANEGSIAKVQD